MSGAVGYVEGCAVRQPPLRVAVHRSYASATDRYVGSAPGDTATRTCAGNGQSGTAPVRLGTTTSATRASTATASTSRTAPIRPDDGRRGRRPKTADTSPGIPPTVAAAPGPVP